MSVRMTVVAVSVWLLSGGKHLGRAIHKPVLVRRQPERRWRQSVGCDELYKILGNNCDPTHLCPPYFDGRISNGPVASEQLASKLFPGSVTRHEFSQLCRRRCRQRGPKQWL